MVAKKKPNRKLDIFKVLSNIDTKNVQFYKNLSDEEKKGFLPIIVSRWLSGTPTARQLYFINELVNPFVFSLHKHPELLYDLMTLCGSGKSQRHYWNKTVSNKSTKHPNVIGVIREHFGYNTLQSIEALPLLSNDDRLEYAEDLGRQKDIITKIKKELRTR